MNLTSGQTFNITGYDVLGLAANDDGHTLVLGNGCGDFIVADVDTFDGDGLTNDGEYSAKFGLEAIVVDVFRCNAFRTERVALMAAFNRMARRAAAHLSV